MPVLEKCLLALPEFQYEQKCCKIMPRLQENGSG